MDTPFSRGFSAPPTISRRRADRDGVPYPKWAEDGFITPTPGNVVDFRAVENCIREACTRFDVREIAFDPYLARNTMNNLLDDGLPAVEMRQGWATMAPAIKELERAIIGRRFAHGGHPVLRWNFSNIAVEVDKAGNNKTFSIRAKAASNGLTAHKRPQWQSGERSTAAMASRFTAMKPRALRAFKFGEIRKWPILKQNS